MRRLGPDRCGTRSGERKISKRVVSASPYGPEHRPVAWRHVQASGSGEPGNRSERPKEGSRYRVLERVRAPAPRTRGSGSPLTGTEPRSDDFVQDGSGLRGAGEQATNPSTCPNLPDTIFSPFSPRSLRGCGGKAMSATVFDVAQYIRDKTGPISTSSSKSRCSTAKPGALSGTRIRSSLKRSSVGQRPCCP